MKRSLILLYAVFLYSAAFAQLNVLFVNDNNVDSASGAAVMNALTASGYNVSYHDASPGISPTYAGEMQGKGLVVWHTSTDGVGNQLWAGNDTTNTELKTYLDNGGNLWVTGNDFLYDRYGAAPVTFVPGDFAYDYFGISSYDAQSYGNDGNQGVPQMDLQSGHGITTIDPVLFKYATLWWADGCTPVAGAQEVYRMGPAGVYSLDNLASAIYYDNGTSRVLSYYFDIGLMDTQTNIDKMVKDVLDYFSVTGVEDKNELTYNIYPNPATDHVNIRFDNPVEPDKIELYNTQGQLVYAAGNLSMTSGLTLHLPDLPSGMYYLKTTTGNLTEGKRLLLQH